MKNKKFFWIMIFFFLLITLTACSGNDDSPSTVVTAISAGDSHTVALKNDGTVLTWGLNSYGQLGDGTSKDSHTPVPVVVWGLFHGQSGDGTWMELLFR